MRYGIEGEAGSLRIIQIENTQESTQFSESQIQSLRERGMGLTRQTSADIHDVSGFAFDLKMRSIFKYLSNINGFEVNSSVDALVTAVGMGLEPNLLLRDGYDFEKREGLTQEELLAMESLYSNPGLTQIQIAEKLNLAHDTYTERLTRVYRKLDINGEIESFGVWINAKINNIDLTKSGKNFIKRERKKQKKEIEAQQVVLDAQTIEEKREALEIVNKGGKMLIAIQPPGRRQAISSTDTNELIDGYPLVIKISANDSTINSGNYAGPLWNILKDKKMHGAHNMRDENQFIFLLFKIDPSNIKTPEAQAILARIQKEIDEAL